MVMDTSQARTKRKNLQKADYTPLSETPRLKRQGVLKNYEGDCIPYNPASAFIPAINGRVFCGNFIKYEV